MKFLLKLFLCVFLAVEAKAQFLNSTQFNTSIIPFQLTNVTGVTGIGSGTVTGTGTNPRVAVWNGSSSIGDPTGTVQFNDANLSRVNILTTDTGAILGTNVLGSGGSALGYGSLTIEGTNGHATVITGVNSLATNLPGITAQIDSFIPLYWDTNLFYHQQIVRITNRNDIATISTNLFEAFTTNGGYVMISNNASMRINSPGGLSIAGGTGLIAMTAGTAPATPASGIGNVYVDSTSKNLSVKDDAGVVKHGVQTDTGAANNFITAIADNGAITKAQPTVANISSPSDIVTNGYTPNLTLAGASNTVTGVIYANNVHAPTNSGSALTPDFALAVTLLQTNAAFTFLGPVHVDAGNKLYQTTVTFVTNSTAAAVAITLPSGVRGVGTQFVTNLTRIDWEVYGGNKFTNAYFLPVF